MLKIGNIITHNQMNIILNFHGSTPQLQGRYINSSYKEDFFSHDSRGNIPRCPAPISFVHISFDGGSRVGKSLKGFRPTAFPSGVIAFLLEFQPIAWYTPTNRMMVFRPEILPTDRPTYNQNTLKFLARKKVSFTRY